MKVKDLREILQGLDGEKKICVYEMHGRQFDSDIEVFKEVQDISFKEDKIVLKK